MKWFSQHSLWFLAFSFRLQFILPKQHFSDVYIFWYYHLWCSVTWSLGTFFEEYWFPGWLSNGLHHCACVQPLFLWFLIVLFLCAIYHKTKYTPQIPNTSPPKHQIQSVSINMRATIVIPILNCPLCSIYLLFLFSYFADSAILPNQTTFFLYLLLPRGGCKGVFIWLLATGQ